jgi:hypothetical protein
MMRDNGKGVHFIGRSLNNIRYKRVEKVEYIGERDIYNLTAGATHTYVANGFVTANTGGEMDKGGSVFEAEFKNALKQWREKNYEYGIIPLFFNAYARPGVDAKYLNKERKAYMSEKDSKKAELARVQFHQAYPITIDDMFVRKARTMIPLTKCNDRLQEIYAMQPEVQYGYYEPIYDTSQPTPDSFVPFKILGAKFVRTLDEFDVNTSCCIVNHPVPGEMWRWRWFQGTDPVNSETGHSKMSSAVWDALTNSVSAMIFHRDRNFRYSYLQCMLQRLYFDQLNQGGIPELVENNIGDMYVIFQEDLGFKRNIVANMALSPDYFRKPGGKWFGISNKVDTAPRILAKMEEMAESYADNINIPWVWNQFKTFVEKDLKSTNSHRQTRYQAADLRYDSDDCLFSADFAYINALSHARHEPVNIASEMSGRKVFTRYVQSHETGYRMKLAQVDEKGRIVKILGN